MAPLTIDFSMRSPSYKLLAILPPMVKATWAAVDIPITPNADPIPDVITSTGFISVIFLWSKTICVAIEVTAPATKDKAAPATIHRPPSSSFLVNGFPSQ